MAGAHQGLGRRRRRGVGGEERRRRRREEDERRGEEAGNVIGLFKGGSTKRGDCYGASKDL